MAEFEAKKLAMELKKSNPRKPIPFGFCEGKKPETSILIANAKKSNSKALAEEAKKACDGNKVSHGMCYLDKKELHFDFAKDAGNAAKKIKVLIKKNNMTFKVAT